MIYNMAKDSKLIKGKVKQVSFTKLDDFLKNCQNDGSDFVTIDMVAVKNKENILEVDVKEFLTITEMCQFIEETIDGCFIDVAIDDTYITKYAPYYKDIYIVKNILKFYTNIKEIESIERLEKISYTSKIIERIQDVINMEQFETILSSINDGIEFRKQQLLNKQSSKLDSVFDGLNQIFKTIDKKIEGLDVSNMAEFAPKIIDIFASGKVNPENFADAFLKAKSEEIDNEEDVKINSNSGNKVIDINVNNE